MCGTKGSPCLQRNHHYKCGPIMTMPAHVCALTTILVLCALYSTPPVQGLDDVREYSQYLRSLRSNTQSPDGKLSDLLMKSIRFRDLDSQDYPNELSFSDGDERDTSLLDSDNSLMQEDLRPYASYNAPSQTVFKGTEKRGHGSFYLSQLLNSLKARNGVGKRQQVSVSQLAQLLNNLKTRNTDDNEGVKLNGLRFGKRK